MEISVIVGYDGLKGTIVEKINRVGTPIKKHLGGNDYRRTGKYLINYKGNKHEAFYIHKAMGYSFSGYCISIKG